MLDAVVRNEGEPDVVQISGGEPTIHPDFFAILDAARSAADQAPDGQHQRHAHRPATRRSPSGWPTYMPGFEVYLQFDSLERGAAAASCAAPTCATCAPQALDAAQRARHLDDAGRHAQEGPERRRDRADHRLRAAAAVRARRDLPADPGRRPAGGLRPGHRPPDADRGAPPHPGADDVFRPEDIIPVPCHPDSLAMAYALKLDGAVMPLTGLIDPQVLIDGGRNTIVFEQDDGAAAGGLQAVRDQPLAGVAAPPACATCCAACRRSRCPTGSSYDNVFRVMIVQFIDAHSFDVRSVKKTCVHIVHPDGRLIPFDTYNLFYRDDLEQTRLGAAAPRAGAAVARSPCRLICCPGRRNRLMREQFPPTTRPPTSRSDAA